MIMINSFFHISLPSCCDEVSTLKVPNTNDSVDVSINDDLDDTIDSSIVDNFSKRIIKNDPDNG